MNINNQLREYTALMNYPALIEREREREFSASLQKSNSGCPGTATMLGDHS
jgi:hypothetical protein